MDWRKMRNRAIVLLLVIPVGRRRKSGLATSIHTLGMRFPIAAVWMAESGEVVHAVLANPWRPYYGSPRPASYVLEMHPVHFSALHIGSLVSWQPNESAMLHGHDRQSTEVSDKG